MIEMPNKFESDAQRRAAFARMSGKGTNAFNRDASVRAANTLPDTPLNRKEWANNTRRIDLEGVDTPVRKGELPKKDGLSKDETTKLETMWAEKEKREKELEKRTADDHDDLKRKRQIKEMEDYFVEKHDKNQKMDKFLQKQGTPFYHGTDVKFKSFDIGKAGSKGNEVKFKNAIYVSKNKDFVKQYGKNTIKAYISPKAKIIDYDHIKHHQKYGVFLDKFFEKNKNAQGDEVKEAFARKYYDGITYGSNEYVIFNPKVIKTEAQLIEKWESEHNRKPMYELQRHEPNPHGHKEALTKNRTYQPMRWKGIAQSQDVEKLKNTDGDYRVVNLDTLEVV